jgi:hypothetical protein
MGTEIVRPSLSSTINASSVTSTRTAAGRLRLSIEVLIPSFHEHLPVVGDDTPDSTKFSRGEANAVFNAKWIEPELRDGVIALDTNVVRLAAVT